MGNDVELSILKTMFNRAIDWGLVGTNPVKGVRLPKTNEVTVRFLTKAEVSKLLKVIESDNNILFPLVKDIL